MPVPADRSLRLPEVEYFAEPQHKSGIALHHTVCDSARNTLALWRRDQTPGGGRKRVATAFVIEKDGTVYEAFDPECWAWQFGLNWPKKLRIPFEKRFIGVEISSEGGLIEEDGELYAFERVSQRTRRSKDEALECPTPYRGYRWFARYPSEQLDALGRLVHDLCTRFAIPRVYPDQPFVHYGDALASFEGVIGHAMVRPDKSDPAPDPRLWQTLREAAGLTPVPVSAKSRDVAVTPFTPHELTVHRVMNDLALEKMDVAAGSLLKTLLQELARREVYLTVYPRDSHLVRYQVKRGDPGKVAPLARALGFKNVTEEFLEVRDA